jgi:MraZ protein
VYLGNSSLSLDAKGRMMVPSKYRDALQKECEGQLYITRSPVGCLLLLPLPVWEQMAREIITWGEELDVYREIYFSSAEPVTWDGTGRILIPPSLRAKAKLDKDIEMFGNGTHFRIWNAQVYDAHEQAELSKEKPAAIKNFRF